MKKTLVLLAFLLLPTAPALAFGTFPPVPNYYDVQSTSKDIGGIYCYNGYPNGCQSINIGGWIVDFNQGGAENVSCDHNPFYIGEFCKEIEFDTEVDSPNFLQIEWMPPPNNLATSSPGEILNVQDQTGDFFLLLAVMILFFDFVVFNSVGVKIRERVYNKILGNNSPEGKKFYHD